MTGEREREREVEKDTETKMADRERDLPSPSSSSVDDVPETQPEAETPIELSSVSGILHHRPRRVEE